LFNRLDAEFHFTIDLFALAENAKFPKFFSPADDGLAQSWTGICWLNPPYGRQIGLWLAKAQESALVGATVVALNGRGKGKGNPHKGLAFRSLRCYYILYLQIVDTNQLIIVDTNQLIQPAKEAT